MVKKRFDISRKIRKVPKALEFCRHIMFYFRVLLFSSINFIAFALYLAAIQRLPISEYQFTELIGPIVGAIAAYFILGEMVKPQHIWGLLIIGTGLFVALRNA